MVGSGLGHVVLPSRVWAGNRWVLHDIVGTSRFSVHLILHMGGQSRRLRNTVETTVMDTPTDEVPSEIDHRTIDHHDGHELSWTFLDKHGGEWVVSKEGPYNITWYYKVPVGSIQTIHNYNYNGEDPWWGVLLSSLEIYSVGTNGTYKFDGEQTSNIRRFLSHPCKEMCCQKEWDWCYDQIVDPNAVINKNGKQ